MKIVIIMGSKGDLEHSKKIADFVKKFAIQCIMKIASAHKVPLKALDILKEHKGENTVFITVAGRSNALSGFVDANTASPVIACPPYSDKFGGADIWSTLRMPSGVCPMLVLEPEEAGLAALKILASSNSVLRKKVWDYQKSLKDKIEKEDKELAK
ncbi:MAG: AIR carboxylase family protein [Planctomycetes bacterium]|nr:AIR carboxylase family protein [Planctomycetota bacterium]